MKFAEITSSHHPDGGDIAAKRAMKSDKPEESVKNVKEAERICEYLRAMASKLGADVTVWPSASKGDYFFMASKGAYPTEPRVKVNLEEPREAFEKKVRELMEGKR